MHLLAHDELIRLVRAQQYRATGLPATNLAHLAEAPVRLPRCNTLKDGWRILLRGALFVFGHSLVVGASHGVDIALRIHAQHLTAHQSVPLRLIGGLSLRVVRSAAGSVRASRRRADGSKLGESEE